MVLSLRGLKNKKKVWEFTSGISRPDRRCHCRSNTVVTHHSRSLPEPPAVLKSEPEPPAIHCIPSVLVDAAGPAPMLSRLLRTEQRRFLGTGTL
ncbi:unnamed protein product [Cuscuta epithymum]|uniref:Uncharacterized protein n=1 Tax=Cuscuta epithymum TaxID=186058 RepID=A0AAV0D6C0_9ASTE|nr:unnamed protein product [Cuscuta epithymum]